MFCFVFTIRPIGESYYSLTDIFDTIVTGNNWCTIVTGDELWTIIMIDIIVTGNDRQVYVIGILRRLLIFVDGSIVFGYKNESWLRWSGRLLSSLRDIL